MKKIKFFWISNRTMAAPCPAMKDLLVLLAHLLTTIAKLLGPAGARAVVADIRDSTRSAQCGITKSSRGTLFTAPANGHQPNSTRRCLPHPA